jgi:hypothetical protein
LRNSAAEYEAEKVQWIEMRVLRTILTLSIALLVMGGPDPAISSTLETWKAAEDAAASA